MTFDVEKLPESLEENHEIVRHLVDKTTLLEDKNILLEDKNHLLKDENLRLEEMVRLLRKGIFGASSEKVPEPTNQLMLFEDESEEDDIESDIEEDEEDELVLTKKRKRKGGGRKKFPKHLPREQIIHDLPLDEKTCCDTEMHHIGEDVRERLRVIPATFIVEEHIYPKYTCKVCRGIASDGPEVVQAKVEKQLIPKSMTTPSLLAHLFASKFVEGMPFYRLEQRFSREGITLTRNNMANWAIKAMDALLPLHNLIADTIRDQPFMGIDETYFQVLKEAGKTPQSKSFMWVFRAELKGVPLIYYQYDPSRKSNVPEAFLEGYKGTVQTDGFVGYDFLDKNEHIRHIVCWSHSRRKFIDVISARKSKKKSSNAEVAVNFIKGLYKVEKKIRKLGLNPEEIVALRKKEALPILERFKKWLDKMARRTPPKRLLGKAISYTLNQWSRLIGYIEDGNAYIDNNLVENSIRPFVIGRKNWLFANSVNGANTAALFYTMMETAKAQNLHPEHYLNYLFTHIPHADTLEKLEPLLPWNVTPEQIKPAYLSALT